MRDRRINRGRFRELRHQAGLTQPQLAALAGVSVNYVKLLERGPTEPSRPYAEVLASSLGCTVNDFTDPLDEAVDAAATGDTAA